MIITLQRVGTEPDYPPESTGCRTHANRVSAMQDCCPAPHAAVSQGLLRCTKEEPFLPWEAVLLEALHILKASLLGRQTTTAHRSVSRSSL